MTPIPLPPPERDPFEGLVLDQSFVRAAAISEDAVHAAGVRIVQRDRLAVVRARVTGSAAPELSRRSVLVCCLAAATLVAGLALVGPGWRALSSAFGDDKPATPHAVVGGAGSWTSSWPAPGSVAVAEPAAQGGASGSAGSGSAGSGSADLGSAGSGSAELGSADSPGAAGRRPVLVDGQLVDPFQDPFAAPRR